jgi:hypothetical protein
LQWRRLAVQALHAAVQKAISTRTLLVWRCWHREDHAHGHVLRAVVSSSIYYPVSSINHLLLSINHLLFSAH